MPESNTDQQKLKILYFTPSVQKVPIAVGTHSDEGLVEAVEPQVPQEPSVGEGRNEPEVEVGHHHKRCAAHHPAERGTVTGNQVVIDLRPISLRKTKDKYPAEWGDKSQG